jgi:hypothetical protein
MQTGEYSNGQRSRPCVHKTGPNLHCITKTVLGCQKTNGINPRSAIRQQKQQQQHLILYHYVLSYDRVADVLFPWHSEHIIWWCVSITAGTNVVLSLLQGDPCYWLLVIFMSQRMQIALVCWEAYSIEQRVRFQDFWSQEKRSSR